MNKDGTKENKRIFIEETIGTRKYFSFRADLLLYKTVICIFIYLSIYIITSEFFISIFITLQAFLIFTLINKLKLERKEKEGRDILLNKTKKDYFKNKLSYIEINNFERLIKYYFKKQGYINYKKIGKHIYSFNNSEETYYLKIMKLNCFDEVEKIDVRSFISLMNNNKIKNGFLVTTNEINEDVNKLIEKLKEHLNITIVNLDNIYDFALECNLLPDNDFFYHKIHTEKTKNNNMKIKILKSNTINNKKIIIYFFAAFLFYILSIAMPYNNLSMYLTYYFIALAVVSSVYLIILKVCKSKVHE